MLTDSISATICLSPAIDNDGVGASSTALFASKKISTAARHRSAMASEVTFDKAPETIGPVVGLRDTERQSLAILLIVGIFVIAMGRGSDLTETSCWITDVE